LPFNLDSLAVLRYEQFEKKKKDVFVDAAGAALEASHAVAPLARFPLPRRELAGLSGAAGR
jgi:hypothetical protein